MNLDNKKKISSCNLLISIVSHGQIELVNSLLSDLSLCDLDNCSIVIRSNIDERDPISAQDLNIIHIKNLRPAGFSQNHNQNFVLKKSNYFAVLNPDLKIHDPQIFKKLITTLYENSTSMVCPNVVDKNGKLEDNARPFPTFLEMFKRLCLRKKSQNLICINNKIEKVDWCAGMFQLYPSYLYKKMNGFNENYFLYCEDVDMGLRLKEKGFLTLINRNVYVEHNARRDSHKSLKYFLYHLKSYIKLYYYMYLKYPMK